MHQRSARQVFALALGLASLTSACEPAGAIEQGQALDDISETAADTIGNAYDDDEVVQVPKGATTATTGSGSVTVGGAAAAGSASPTPSVAAPQAQPQPNSKTLHVDGRRILDTCGQPFVARGMEQFAAAPFSPDGTLNGLANELIKTGSNAVRLLPKINEISLSELDGMLGVFAAQNVVVYISPGDRSWFARSEVKQVLLKHEKGIILDAFQEPDYDDRDRWVRDGKAAIADLRKAGYSAPVTVLANQYGRDLTALLERGQEIVDSDPLHNTIMGWQAYWGESNWYQQSHKMSLTQGIEAAANKSFPVQAGIDLYADNNEKMNYVEVMAAAQKHGISWLWWNFWNQWDGMGNNASHDGRASNLTGAGQVVVNSDPNSIARTAKKACFR